MLIILNKIVDRLEQSIFSLRLVILIVNKNYYLYPTNQLILSLFLNTFLTYLHYQHLNRVILLKI